MAGNREDGRRATQTAARSPINNPPFRQAGIEPIQTVSELDRIKEYTFYGIAMRILDHDIRAAAGSGMKLPRFYESLLRGIQDRVLLDMAGMRRRFEQSGVKVLEEKREQDGLRVHYICRGYNHQFYVPWKFAKIESERILKSYLPR